MRLRSPIPELEDASNWINGYVTRTDLIGEKQTLIHFWSVSCYQCKESMKIVNRFRDQYWDQLNVVAVHMPRSEADTNLEKIERAAVKYNITEPILVDNNLTLSNAFNNRFVPSYYVFDKFGVLRHFQTGGNGMRMVDMSINRLIGR